MRPKRIMTFLICLIVCPSLHAQSLVTQVPANGRWAKFKVEVATIPPDGEADKFTGELIVKCVGTEVRNSETLRWIEIEQTFEVESEEIRIIDKILVLEDSVDSVGGFMSDFRKMWRFHSQFKNNNPKRVVPGSPSAATLEVFIPGRFDDIQELPTREFETDLGMLRCRGVSAESSDTGNETRKYTSYSSQQSPFGTVALRIESRPNRVGEQLETMIIELTLRETGENAISSLPENN